MLLTVKIPGGKLAYDSASGAVIRLSALEFKMLGAIYPPLVPVCPTSLRYELAKFDSETVAETYEKLYELQESGLIYAKDNGKVNIRLDGEYYANTEEEIDAILSTASRECKSKILNLIGECPDIIKTKVMEIAKKHGFE